MRARVHVCVCVCVTMFGVSLWLLQFCHLNETHRLMC